MMWSAAIYARLSRTDKTKSLLNQVNGLKEYAFNNSIDVYKVYEDDGYSGDDMNRPSFLLLINDIEKKKFNTLIVKDMSRLGRNLYKVGKMIEIILPINNIRLISVNDNYDSLVNTITENIIFKNFFNQYYLKEYKNKINKSLNVKGNKQDLFTTGKYGYVIKDKKIILDYEASNVVKMIFDMAKNGYKINEIVIVLNNKGVITRSMYKNKRLNINQKNIATKWSYLMVWSILNDIEYCGYAENFKYSKKNSNNNDVIIISNAHEKIISEEDCEKILSNKKTRGNYKSEMKENILSLIKLKNIRYLYHRRVTHKYYCSDIGFNISINSFHNIVFKEIINSLFNRNINNIIKKEHININKNIKKLENEMNYLSDQLSNVFEDYYMEKIEYQKYEIIRNNVELKIKFLIKNISLLKDKFNSLEKCFINLKDFCFNLNGLQDEVIKFIKKFTLNIYIDNENLKKYKINIILNKY